MRYIFSRKCKWWPWKKSPVLWSVARALLCSWYGVDHVGSCLLAKKNHIEKNMKRNKNVYLNAFVLPRKFAFAWKMLYSHNTFTNECSFSETTKFFFQQMKKLWNTIFPLVSFFKSEFIHWSNITLPLNKTTWSEVSFSQKCFKTLLFNFKLHQQNNVFLHII